MPVRPEWSAGIVRTECILVVRACLDSFCRAGAADDAAERPDASDMPSRQQLSSYAQEQWEVWKLHV